MREKIRILATVGLVLVGTLGIGLGGASPIAAVSSISYQNLGYPWWPSASAVNVGQFDWGYVSCPSNDANCFALRSTTSGASCAPGASGCYGEADPWAYYLRNCTSFVAWYLANHNIPFSDFNFSSYGVGNGSQWLQDAQSSPWNSRLTTGSTAEVGSVAVSVPNNHVMIVTAVNSDGTITVEEYNQDLNGDGDIQNAMPSALGINGYIYYNSVPGSTTGGGGGGGLSISESSLAGGAVGEPYSAPLTASGGSGGYEWGLASGNLPAGLGLTTQGDISGVPDESGLSSFTVRVTDSSGATATANLSITIGPSSLLYFYTGSDGAVHIWDWNGSEWLNQSLGGGVQAGTSPSAIYESDGSILVFYVGTDDGIHLLLWNGTDWTQQDSWGSS